MYSLRAGLRAEFSPNRKFRAATASGKTFRLRKPLTGAFNCPFAPKHIPAIVKLYR